MTFPFRFICELLERLEIKSAGPLNTDRLPGSDAGIIPTWFQKHSSAIPRQGSGAIAFLSCLFPERRPDRVFGLKKRQLELIIQRAHCLGSSRMVELQSLQSSGQLDFAASVEPVTAITDCEPRVGPELTVEEIDNTLDQVAALSSFSSANLREAVREKYGHLSSANELLSRVFARLKSFEAKWMIRMMFKSYSPAHIPNLLATSHFHFLLPDLLRFQDSISAAVEILSAPNIQHMPARTTVDTYSELREIALRELMPRVGVMVVRSDYEKSRSIKHCCQLAGSREMSMERKYDGEYCQVHVRLDTSSANIQIFSKSGRDSTQDRTGIHQAVRDSLRLGTTGCRIKKQCILEGELLVWNSEVGRIEPFYKIRRHVQRAGRHIGTARDSLIARSERLMIIFYDIMLLDDTFCARQSQDTRRHLLERLVHRIPSQADVGSRQVIRFSSTDAAESLRKAFSNAIAQRWEGLVLKGCHDPYPSFCQDRASIKLKKDYIPGLGNTADFVVLGGHYDVREAHDLGIGKVWWTSFYIATLENKEEVCNFAAKPQFRIIDVIDKHGIRKQDFLFLNRHGYFSEAPFDQSLSEFEAMPDRVRRLQPSTLFRIPFMVEVVGAGFDKPANAGYYILRFPRVLKIHADRALKDTIGFVELQNMAKRCIAAPDDGEWEEQRWYTRLGGNKPWTKRRGSDAPDAGLGAGVACQESECRTKENDGAADEPAQADHHLPQSLKRRQSRRMNIWVRR